MRLIALLILGGLFASPAIGDSAARGAAARSGAVERGWAVHMDNDLFAFNEHDRDYTAGVSFTIGGERAVRHPLSLSRALRWTDDKTRFRKLLERGEREGDALELGLLLFTPQDLSSEEPLFDDRPYANLLYAASTMLTHDASRGVAYQSSLTVGFLGLSLAERVHGGIHDVFGSDEPRGYMHEISDGGEPTARYAISRQKLLASGGPGGRPYTLRFGVEGSVGYLTEASAEISIRRGRTRLPWWSSPPTAFGIAGHPPIGGSAAGAPRRTEVLFEAGARVRARLYNSFLQGQFRDSTVEFDSSDLNHVLLEAWVGVTVLLKNDLSIGYSVRRHSEEIRNGGASRAFTWAGIDVAQRF